MSTITLGVDLAKRVFSVCEMDAAGHVLRRQELKREAFATWLGQQPACAVVAMEACSGAHHWARRCFALGLQPKVIAAQFVGPFRKSRTTKNDRNDAEAIATAARQGNMRFVPVKSADHTVSGSRGTYSATRSRLGRRRRAGRHRFRRIARYTR